MPQHQWFLCVVIVFHPKRNKEINHLWHTSAAHFNTSHHTAAEWGESKRTVSRTTHHHPGTAWKPAGGWTVSGLAACSTYNRRNWRQMLLLLPSEGRCDVTGCRGNTAEEEVVPGNTWTAGWHAGGSFNVLTWSLMRQTYLSRHTWTETSVFRAVGLCIVLAWETEINCLPPSLQQGLLQTSYIQRDGSWMHC